MMNTTFTTKNILRFLLLIFIAFSSGCEQSTVVDSQNPTPVIPTVDATPLPCFSLPQIPTTDIEIIAENWFLSEIPQITNRDQYRFADYLDTWVGFCKIYQHAIQSGEDWTKSPIEIALRIATNNVYLEIFIPNQIILVAENDQNLILNKNDLVPSATNRNIAIVMINHSQGTAHYENRFDFVRENGIWKIRWWGNRWKCINDEAPTWTSKFCF